MRLSDIGEFGFIDRIAPLGLIRPEKIVRGIGDDCAVIELDGGMCLLVTTDLLIERIHFQRSWGSPHLLGRKALAVNVSDIAACGGIPRDAFVSLAIPDDVSVEWLDALYEGLMSSAREFDINVLGGDTTKSRTDLVINIALTGLVSRDEVLLRNTARPDDVIVLTGQTGLSAAGCHVLLNGLDLSEDLAGALKTAHLDPTPHVREGRFLAASQCCTAAIDLSDGLSSDLAHICNQSGVGAIVDEERVPIPETLRSACRHAGRDPLYWALHGGEDYVLLATVRESCLPKLQEDARWLGIQCLPIGVIVREPGVRMRRISGIIEQLIPEGWDHFAGEGSVTAPKGKTEL